MTGSNCPIFGMVDFGEGLVKVFCTETGPHVNHQSVVQLAVPSSVHGRPCGCVETMCSHDIITPNEARRMNVFDERDTKDD